ncbi:hypothetical protein QBC38DRAFT_59013 [Podospora fimiseda]|uniref:Uncharacterized protein n=1 Tax=Podospora fimiseda TaxID=252190 RepID=A0AAN7BH31_9PEZI|nr:hypothetical protein QBC38DRAFT_59013 [Podospora fimiseda]
MPPKTALLAATLAAASKALAQTTSVVTHWCPEVWDYGPLVYTTNGKTITDELKGHRTSIYASVINADATATTYSIDCVYGTWAPEPYQGCDNNPNVTYTLGPKTVDGRMIQPIKPYDFTRGFDCDIIDATTASCDFILDGRMAQAVAQTGRWPNDPDEYTGTDWSFYYQPFTITAGLEKLAAATPTAAGGSPVRGGQTIPASTGSSPTQAGAQETGSSVPTSGASKGVVRNGFLATMAGIAAAVWGIGVVV